MAEKWHFWPTLALAPIVMESYSSQAHVVQILIADLAVNKGSAFRIILPHLVGNPSEENTVIVMIGEGLVDVPMLLPLEEARALDEKTVGERWKNHCADKLKKHIDVETEDPLLKGWLVSIMPEGSKKALAGMDTDAGRAIKRSPKVVEATSFGLYGLLQSLVEQLKTYLASR